MFGTHGIEVLEQQLRYKVDPGGYYTIYNAEGKTFMSFKALGYGSCSNQIVQGFTFNKMDTNQEVFKKLLFRLFGNKVIFSIQNTSKNDYNNLKEIGFIDYCRLPGEYIEDDDDNEDNTKGNCLSMMVLTDKDLTESAETSVQLLTEINNK
jgi:hypothetical protein